MLIKSIGVDYRGKYTNLKEQGANPSFQKALPEYALDTRQAKSFVDEFFKQGRSKTLDLLKKAVEFLPASTKGLSKEKSESINFFKKLKIAMQHSKKNTIEESIEKLDFSQIAGMPSNAKFKTALSFIEKDPRFAPFYKTLTGELIKAPEAKIQKELAADVVEITPKTQKTIKKIKAKENFEQGKKLYVENLPNRIAAKEAEIADSISIRYEYKEQLTELNKEIKRLENKRPEIVDVKTDETTMERNKFLTIIKNLETRTNPAYTKRLKRSISELEKKSANLKIPDTRLQDRITRKKILLTSILDGSKQKALDDVKREYAEFSKKNPLTVAEELSEIAEKRLEYKNNIKTLKNQTSQEYINNLRTKIAELKKQQSMPIPPDRQIQKELEQNNRLMQRILNGNVANDLETTEVQYKIFSQQNPQDNSSRVKNKRKEYTTKINELKQMLKPSYLEGLEKKSAQLKEKLEAPTLPFINLEKEIAEKEAFLKELTDGTKQQELKKLEQEYSEFSQKHPEPEVPKQAMVDKKSDLSNLKDQKNVLLTKMEIEKNRLESAKKEVSGLQKELKVENKRKKGKLNAQRQKQRSEEAKLNPKTNETGGGRIARTKQKNKVEEEVLEYKPTPEQLDRLRRLNVQIAHLSNEISDLYEKSHDIMFKLYGGNRSFYGATKSSAIIEDYSKRMEDAKKISDKTQRSNTIGSLMKQGNHELMSIQDIGLIKKVENLAENLKTASEAEKPSIQNEIQALNKQIKNLQDEDKQIKEAIDKLHQKSRPLEKEAISIEYGTKLE